MAATLVNTGVCTFFLLQVAVDKSVAKCTKCYCNGRMDGWMDSVMVEGRWMEEKGGWMDRLPAAPSEHHISGVLQGNLKYCVSCYAHYVQYFISKCPLLTSPSFKSTNILNSCSVV